METSRSKKVSGWEKKLYKKRFLSLYSQFKNVLNILIRPSVLTI